MRGLNETRFNECKESVSCKAASYAENEFSKVEQQPLIHQDEEPITNIEVTINHQVNLNTQPIQVLNTRTDELVPKERGRGINFSNLVNVKKFERSCTTKVCSMKCAVVNTQSVRNKLAEFHELLLTNQLDICCVTETWLKESDEVITANLHPDGYKSLQIPRRIQEGGGVAVVYREDIKVKKWIYPSFIQWRQYLFGLFLVLFRHQRTF